jgi:E3 ubiquitin-protein ligase RNF14
MRLWELEGGDGDDVGIGFMGGQRGREEEMHVVNGQFEVVEDAVVEAGAEVEDMVAIAWNLPDNAEPGPNQPLQFAEPVAREGPLVLRINQLPPQPPAQPRVVQNLHNANLGRRPHQQRHPRGGGGHPEQRPAGGRHVAAAARRRAHQIPPGRRPPAAAPLPEWARQLLEPQEVGEVRPPERELGPHDHEWVENFVRMALNDEEDQVDWDSDDEDNGEAWQIPVR